MTLLLRLADAADAASRGIGAALKWLAVLLVLVQFAVVVLRYVYGSSFIWMQESVTYLHATLFMLAIAYTYLLDGHVRVDVLYAGWSARRRAAVDIIGILVGVLPFCALMLWASWPDVSRSWALGEGPMQYGGLPLTPLFKSLLPAMAALLAVQALSIAIRAAAVLAGRAETHFPARPAASAHG